MSMVRYELFIDFTHQIQIDLLSTLPSNKTVEPKSIRNARLLYKSCVDEDTIKNGSAEIESFLEDEFDSDFDLINILLTLNQYNLFIFYEIQTVNDPLFARFLNSQVLKVLKTCLERTINLHCFIDKSTYTS